MAMKFFCKDEAGAGWLFSLSCNLENNMYTVNIQGKASIEYTLRWIEQSKRWYIQNPTGEGNFLDKLKDWQCNSLRLKHIWRSGFEQNVVLTSLRVIDTVVV